MDSEEPPAEDDDSPTVAVEGWQAVPPRRDRRHRHGSGFTDEEILHRIGLYAEVTGAPPTKADWNATKLMAGADKAREKAETYVEKLVLYQEGDWPSETTVRDRFGSLNAALVMAGFEPRASGRQPKSPRRRNHAVTGTEGLDRLYTRVRDLRESRSGSLRSALYDLGHAAVAEAERLGGP